MLKRVLPGLKIAAIAFVAIFSLLFSVAGHVWLPSHFGEYCSDTGMGEYRDRYTATDPDTGDEFVTTPAQQSPIAGFYTIYAATKLPSPPLYLSAPAHWILVAAPLFYLILTWRRIYSVYKMKWEYTSIAKAWYAGTIGLWVYYFLLFHLGSFVNQEWSDDLARKLPYWERGRLGRRPWFETYWDQAGFWDRMFFPGIAEAIAYGTTNTYILISFASALAAFILISVIARTLKRWRGWPPFLLLHHSTPR